MHLENFDQNRRALEAQYSSPVFDETSGKQICILEKECEDICQRQRDASRMSLKSELLCHILSNAQIAIEPSDIFANNLNHGNILIQLRASWKKELDSTLMSDTLDKYREEQKRRIYTGEVDFSHTIPDWQAVLELGATGLLARLERYARQEGLSDEQKDFYSSTVKVYRAIIVYIKRLAAEAEKLSQGDDNMAFAARNLRNLAERAPETLPEAMQLTVIFFYLQTYLEGSLVRSLGNLDVLYESFYREDIARGRYTEQEIREIIKYFYIKFYAFQNDNNVPFYMCGTDSEGNAVFNELTELLLDVYGEMNILDPKIQIRYHKDLPDAFVKKVLRMIASGNSSVVFLNDGVVIDSLTSIGQSVADASNYAPVGCYEPCAAGKEVACTCSGRINLAKVLEIAIADGADMKTGTRYLTYTDTVNTFDGFYARYKETVACFIERTMEIINEYEQYYPILNPSPLFSGTMEECVRDGRDVYAGGAKYNNTSISVFGIATAIDSLVVLKKSVFEERRLTLHEFFEVLQNNWNDSPELYLRCKNKYPKYGNGDEEVDEMSAELISYVSRLINGKKNGRGGVYRCGLFSINWNYGFGAETAATPDGRKCGDPISKNLSSGIGRDKNGVTGVIRSVGKINFKAIPDGAVLDIVLHKSAVRGDEGIAALLGLLKTYFMSGGMAMQFNILDPEVLKRAQREPEQYSTLQIRLCGWNVYFINLSKEEQDEFIAMSELNGAE